MGDITVHSVLQRLEELKGKGSGRTKEPSKSDFTRAKFETKNDKRDDPVRATIRWPTESLEAERKFGHPAARLYPFLRKKVLTPKGEGTLVQVFADRVQVNLPKEEKLLAFHPRNISILGD